MGKIWSDQDFLFLKENYQNFSCEELANKLGRTIDAIQIKAGRNNIHKEKPWDNEKFRAYVKEKGSNEYEVVGDFVNVETKIKIKHLICGNIWEVVPSSFIYANNKCYFCSKRKKLTNEEFIERLKNINSNIIPLEQYINSNTKIKFKCLKDGYEWITTPGCVLSGQGCRKCAGTNTPSEEEFLETLREINPNIILLSEYKRMKSKVLVKCSIDGYKWIVEPSRLIHGNGCPRCGGVSKYSTLEFSEKMKKINPDIEIIGDYINNRTKFKVRCLNDGIEWLAAPHTLLKGIGCPCCKSSKGEKKLFSYLNDNKISFVPQYCFDDLFGFYGQPLRIDCAIFNKNELFCLVEIDGIGHRKPIKFNGMTQESAIEKYNLIVQYDMLKNEYCEKNNIPLFRFNYNGKNSKDIPNFLESQSSFFRKEVITD
jgi:hypothetical protein